MIGTIGVLADVLLGEPPTRLHPVVAFGKLMNAVERRVYRDSRIAGAVYTSFGNAVGLSAGLLVGRPFSTYLSVAARSLWDEASGIAEALDAGDLEGARRRLPALVGRDPTDLDEKEIARATVESVAENTVDAIVAPILWRGGALAYRAVNTMDAMVGHRSARYERFGWASARLDDAANWIPARVTAGLVAAVRPSRAADVLRAVRTDAPRHPSPNAGVSEAAFAAALSLRLGGINRYGERVELRPTLGSGRSAERTDIARAVELSKHVTLAAAVLVIPAPGAHGGDGARVSAALGFDVLDLSVSLNPVAPDVGRLLQRHLGAVRTYPDAIGATEALAAALGTSRDRVLLTNGGAEAIAVVAAELGGTTDEPEFSLFPRTSGPRWRSNPNNPTGMLAAAGETAGVWDEAFYPLAMGEWTRGDADEGAVVVGSLTKLFACPGLRIGYVLADDVARFARHTPEWSVNGLAAAVVPELLEAADLGGWAKEVADLRADLARLLQPFDPQPSAANWVLCARAAGLREALAAHGVLVRDCASFGLPGHARVGVPDAAGLERLEEALCRLGA